MKNLQIFSRCLLCLAMCFQLAPQQVTAGVKATFPTQTPPTQTQPPKPEPLEVGKPIERELKGGETHSYQIKLEAGQYLEGVIDQRGIDVVVRVFDPNGKQIDEISTTPQIQGREPFYLIAELTGNHRIETYSLQKNAALGRYEVRVTSVRSSTEQDGTRINAKKINWAGRNLGYEFTKESYQKAIGKLKEARVLFQTIGDHSGERNALLDLGEVYFYLEEYRIALESWKQALALPIVSQDGYLEAQLLDDLGAVYFELGEIQKGLEYAKQALSLSQAVHSGKEEIAILNNIGFDYLKLGEHQLALDYLNQSLKLWQARGDKFGIAYAFTNLARTYEGLGEYQRALDYRNQALELWRALDVKRDEATELDRIGMVYNALGEKQKALDYFNQSLPLQRATASRKGEGSTLKNIASVYASMGDNRKALDYLNQALPLMQATEDHIGEGNTLLIFGSVFISMGEKQKALEFDTQALQQFRSVQYRLGEALALYSLAGVERDGGKLGEAKQQIEKAIEIVEALRTKVSSQELRSSYFATVRKYYDLYIDLLMQMHQRSPGAGYAAGALQVSERARARGLLELLQESHADIRQGVDSGLLEREKGLQQRLNAKSEILLKLKTSAGKEKPAEAMEKEIGTLTNELEQVRSDIRQKSPRYAALTQPEALSLKDIQGQLLDSDTLLLEYALGDEHSYLWAVTQKEITSYELPKGKEIEAAARHVYDLLTAHQEKSGEAKEAYLKRIDEADAQYWPEAAKLSQLLLGPVASQLGTKRLVIVADGALQYVPFAALPVPQVQNSKFKVQSQEKLSPQSSVLSPLIVDHEVVSLPSASTLAVLRRETAGRTPAPKAVAILADPVFEPDDVRVLRALKTAQTKPAAKDEHSPSQELALTRNLNAAIEVGIADRDQHIRRLPGTRQEANEITKLVPEADRQVTVDFAANRTTATDEGLSQYRYVHFATHGILNNSHPELSGLVLSLVDEQARSQDGFLQLSDIYNLKLPVELVVLSACQTALGKEIKGEGLVGLTRGFMYAGAPRVVASLWSVSDASTAELMRGFYQGMLRDKQRPAAALRAAQLAMWKKNPQRNPYYWAGFVLQGEWK